MNTKIYSYLIGALILGIIGILLLQNKSVQTQDSNPQIIIDTGTIIDSGSLLTGIQEDSLVYTNTEYGFQLTLPEGWKGYKVFIYTGNNIESEVSILFALPTSDTTRYGVIDPNDSNRFISGYTGQYQYVKGYADMLILNIWTHKGYQKVISTEDAMRTKDTREEFTRAKSEKYVYTMNSRPQDLPIDISEKKKERDNQGKGDYFQEIKKTFKIL